MKTNNTCEFTECPGCQYEAPKPVVRRLETYGAAFDDPGWLTSRKEVLCIIRRARPMTDSRAKQMLIAAWGLLRNVHHERPEATLAEALNTLDIERYLRTCPRSTVPPRRPVLSVLLSAAHGLPDLRQQPTGRQVKLSDTGRKWLRQAEAGVPVSQMLADGCSADQLRAISAHLAAADVHADREVLRG